MKPIGGIVTNKKSIPENFRKVDTFTTEDLSKLWKVYTVNRDVVDKGRRLENLFWRIWGSERTGRPFSGAVVSSIFMMIYSSDDLAPPRSPQQRQRTRRSPPPRTLALPAPLPGRPPLDVPTPPPAHASSPNEEDPSRLSLEIECPPTPPPSPVRPEAQDTDRAAAPPSSYLSKLPAHSVLAASLQQALPPRPPSPPVPAGARAEPRARRSTPKPSAGPNAPTSGYPFPPTLNLPSPTAGSDGRRPPNATTLSGSVSSEASSTHTSSSGGIVRNPDAPRPPRPRRKKTTFAVGTKNPHTARPRGLRPPPPQRKSSSSSNTAANSPTDNQHEKIPADIPRSLPSQPRRPPRRQDSTISEPDDAKKARDDAANLKGNWLVDPDFRRKYLERMRPAPAPLLMTSAVSGSGKTGPTTAVIEDVATAHSQKVAGRRRKNVLVVDEIVPLKGLKEEDEGDDSTLVGSSGDRRSDDGYGQRKLDPMGVKDGIVPRDLLRRKSELSILFENAKSDASSTSSSGTRR